jgi:hypothetical protein
MLCPVLLIFGVIPLHEDGGKDLQLQLSKPLTYDQRGDNYKRCAPKRLLTIYGPMIYTASNVMVLMRADPLRGQVGGGLGPGN